jgi:bla regulator protein blaR1
MIAGWMAYALVIAVLISVAALIAERIARLRRWPGRWIWISALLLSVALPMLFGLQSARSNAQPAAVLATLAAAEEPPVYARSPIAWVGGNTAAPARRVTVDTWLLAGWAAMSVLVLATLMTAWLQLRDRLQSAVDRESAP